MAIKDMSGKSFESFLNCCINLEILAVYKHLQIKRLAFRYFHVRVLVIGAVFVAIKL